MFIHKLTLTSLQRQYIDIKITEGKWSYLPDKDVNKNISSNDKMNRNEVKGIHLDTKFGLLAYDFSLSLLITDFELYFDFCNLLSEAYNSYNQLLVFTHAAPFHIMLFTADIE